MNRIFMAMRAGCVFVGILGGALVAFTIRGTTQVVLPEGANRDLVERKCGSCHDIEMVAINGRNEERWNATIDEMTGYGLQLTPAERALVLKYLATYLPPAK